MAFTEEIISACHLNIRRCFLVAFLSQSAFPPLPSPHPPWKNDMHRVWWDSGLHTKQAEKYSSWTFLMWLADIKALYSFRLWEEEIVKYTKPLVYYKLPFHLSVGLTMSLAAMFLTLYNNVPSFFSVYDTNRGVSGFSKCQRLWIFITFSTPSFRSLSYLIMLCHAFFFTLPRFKQIFSRPVPSQCKVGIPLR